jgi:subtilisin family serine protease
MSVKAIFPDQGTPGASTMTSHEAHRLLGRPISRITTPEEAWGNSTGKGIKVAVVDSGIDASHPDLVGSVKGGVDVEVNPSGPEFKPCSMTDMFGHGTACAGIIKGVAPEVELYSVKVLGPSLGGSGEAFIAGLRWAIENRMDVVNLSLGTSREEFFAYLHELVDLAYFGRTILVAAANNVPPPSFPSVFSSLISVGNLTSGDPLAFVYRYGERIEMAAPGSNVRVAWAGGGYKTVTGTSFAAPQVSGIVALILSKHPDLTPFELKSVLYAMASVSTP